MVSESHKNTDVAIDDDVCHEICFYNSFVFLQSWHFIIA